MVWNSGTDTKKSFILVVSSAGSIILSVIGIRYVSYWVRFELCSSNYRGLLLTLEYDSTGFKKHEWRTRAARG